MKNNIINLSSYIKKDKFNRNWDRIAIEENLYQDKFPSHAHDSLHIIIEGQKIQLKKREKYIKILSSIIYSMGGLFLFLIIGLIIKSSLM